MPDDPPGSARHLVLPSALTGAASAVLGGPVAAALVAVVYRFPVPFAGYAHGIDGALTAALGSLFYLLLGGVLVLALLGAAGGAAAARIWAPRLSRALAMSVAFGCVVALAGALSLALLEYLAGPW